MANAKDRLKKISDLLDAALKLNSNERIAFLTKSCEGDDELLSDVKKHLIRAEEVLDGSPESGAHGFAPFLKEMLDLERVENLQNALKGQKIKGYELQEELGRGGMGVVYRAERVDGQFEKTVAIKLLRDLLDTSNLFSRFEYEKQILASLDHDNISRLIDGGVTDEGRPYFIMEYVEGIPITEYCDNKRLTTKERLDLFGVVSTAVQYAHQNLVIHRDIKPSNILVTAQGSVKLLDFGIAKLVDDEGKSQGGATTQDGARLMTPEYASPEQIKAETVSTTTDVYQLGVLLYELLTGRRPYDLPSRLRHEVVRVILEEEPTRPSRIVTEAGETSDGDKIVPITPETVSKARSTTTDALKKSLSGDLDSIIISALEKEPSRRYQSVESFLEDVGRHLKNEPVHAAKGNKLYRAKKFVRRHRPSVVATSLVIIAFLLGFAGVLWQAARTTAEANKTEAVKDFLAEMLEASDPWNYDKANVTVREILDQNAEKISLEFEKQPEIQAELQRTIGIIYKNLGLYDQSENSLVPALNEFESLYGSHHRETALSLSELAHLRFAQASYSEADSLYNRAYSLFTSLGGNNQNEIVETLDGRGLTLEALGKYDEAERALLDALKLKNSPSADSTEKANLLAHLAIVLEKKGELDEAELLHREALLIRSNSFGVNSPEVTTSMRGLAVCLWNKGDYAQADSIFQETLSRQRLHFGEHPEVANTLTSYGLLLQQKGELVQAETLLVQASRMYGNYLSDDHPAFITSLNNLGGVFYHKGEYDKAATVIREIILITEETFGANHPEIATYKHNLGVLLVSDDDLEGSERELREAMKILRSEFKGDHIEVAMVLRSLAWSLEAGERYEEAEDLYIESLNMQRRILDDAASPEIALVLNNMGIFYLKQQNYVKAESYMREALNMHMSTVGETWITANTRSNLGAILLKQERYDEAELLLVMGYDSLLAKRGENDLYTTGSRERLEELYIATKNDTKAAKYASP